MHEKDTGDFAKTILAAGAAQSLAGMNLAQPAPGISAPYAIVPPGYDVEGLENKLPRPIRKRGGVDMHTVASLIQYVNLHKQENTQIYVDMQSATPRVVAVLNDHAGAPDGAEWCDHTATYTALLSPEWKIWSGQNGRPMNQKDFAAFVERNLVDIREPAGATMLEMARTFQAKTKAEFRSATTLQNGEVKFAYDEEINGTAGVAGQMTIPEEILIAIPVLVGGTTFGISAKFRYNIEGSKLALWYEMVRPHKVMEAAVKAIADAIEAPDTAMPPVISEDGVELSPGRAAGTGIRVLYGTP